jgi:hypothetical protein
MNVEVEMHVVNCGVCGGVYAITERVREHHYKNGTSWTCPYCRTGWGYKESEADRLKKKLEDERRRASALSSTVDRVRRQRDHALAQRNGMKGALRAAQKKVLRGDGE